jgi:hypothetical protein
MRSSIIVATLGAVSMVQAANFVVQVGAGGKLAFTPNTVQAANGDTISFQFSPKNHSLTQSTFAAPCTKMSTPTVGVDSGFMFVQPNATELPSFTIAVNDSTVPLWFYCAQTTPVSHCEAGMVFAINPTANKTFAQFQQTAMALNTTANGTTPGSGSSTGAAAGSTGAPAAGPGGSPASVGGSGSSSASGTPPASSSTASGAERNIRVGGMAAGALTVAGLALGLAL